MLITSVASPSRTDRLLHPLPCVPNAMKEMMLAQRIAAYHQANVVYVYTFTYTYTDRDDVPTAPSTHPLPSVWLWLGGPLHKSCQGASLIFTFCKGATIPNLELDLGHGSSAELASACANHENYAALAGFLDRGTQQH